MDWAKAVVWVSVVLNELSISKYQWVMESQCLCNAVLIGNLQLCEEPVQGRECAASQRDENP